MKIAYCSDLHLEVDGPNFTLPEADVLILAGDILISYDLRDAFEFNYVSVRQREFLKDVSKKYKHVIYIPGNHEYWDNTIDGCVTDIDNFLEAEGLANIYFSTEGSIQIDKTKFIFTTLWTDINKGAPREETSYYMNDYRRIKLSSDNPNVLSRMLREADVMTIHEMNRNFILSELEPCTPTIVVTHHAPDLKSVGQDRDSIKYFYGCTDMTEIIEANPQITHWIHGHTHNPIEYTIGKTKILSNPRGYHGYEEISKNFNVKTFNTEN